MIATFQWFSLAYVLILFAEANRVFALLAPVSGDMVIPDLRWVVGGGFAVIFLLVGWVRAAR